MKKTPFLNRFRQPASTDRINVDCVDELYYSLDQRLNLTKEGQIFWSARTRRRPTSCYTAPRRLKAGYTRSGKWKPSRMAKSKQDKRAGR